MRNQKELWEKLAKKNSKYYINSDHGKGITEEQFVKSGLYDAHRFITTDHLIKQGGSFLEIGCGIGRLLYSLPSFFKKIVGIDISGEMIKQAKENYKELDILEYFEFIETDGYLIPLEDDSMDIVFSYIVFQHFKTKEMFESNFKEAFRVLKSDGMFKVRIRIDNVDEKMDSWWAGVSYTEEEVTELANNCGFKVIKTEQVKDYGLWLWLKK